MKKISENKKYMYFEIIARGNVVKIRVNKLTYELGVNLYDSISTYGLGENKFKFILDDIALDLINDYHHDNPDADLWEYIDKLRGKK